MKITIYELLGLIKDGKAPKHIKDVVTGRVYNYDDAWKDYRDEDNSYYLMDIVRIVGWLENEIEIIEEVEDKLIPDHISNEFIQSLDKEMIKHIAHKVNEIINYLQHISKEDK